MLEQQHRPLLSFWSLLIIVSGSAFRISGTPNRKPGVVAVKSVYMLRAASEAEAERYVLKLLTYVL